MIALIFATLLLALLACWLWYGLDNPKDERMSEGWRARDRTGKGQL